MKRQSEVISARELVPHDPALLRALLGDVHFAPLWLLPRIVLGWIWLDAGWRQLRALPGSLGSMTANGSSAIGPLAFGLTLAGIALLLGALTGPTAFIGGCLSVGLWAGESLAMTALQFAAVVWLVLAWKTAGWIGLDRWLLPLLGLPWRGGVLFSRERDKWGATGGNGHDAEQRT